MMLKHSNIFLKIILLTLISSLQPLFAQQSFINTKILSQIDSINKVAPREKLYVHLDRTTYMPEDTLWFKAYLVDAGMNNTSKVSGLIYFEMINNEGKLVQAMSLPAALGVTWAGFALKPTLYKAGNYTLRAYTNWMQNFDQSYFFKKDIHIVDFMKDVTTLKEKITTAILENTATATSPDRKSQEIDIQFLPESGVWLKDKTQKMAFKAINQAGKGIKVNGEILDSKQKRVASFQSNDKGMGFFEMFPIENENYSVKISDNALVIHAKFPTTSATGNYLRVLNDYNRDSLRVFTYVDLPEQDMMMIGQSRGIVCFNAKLKSKTAYPAIKIAKSLFPTGVCQVILINAKGQVVNERNFFINHQNELKINANAQRRNYGIRDSIYFDVKVNDINKKTVTGSFSVAVTDDNQIKKDGTNDENILSYFLLSSDLKGEIETPGYYFHDFNERRHNDLESLMLTQGWVSYNWDLDKKLVFKKEKDFTISGRVTNMLKKPSAKAKIILYGKKKTAMLLDTITNENGEFIFDDFAPMDSSSFVIQAKNSKGKSGTLSIALNDFKRLDFLSIVKNKKNIVEEPLDSVSKELIATKTKSYEITDARSGIALKEVKIIGKKIIPESKNLNGPGNADFTVTTEELNKVAKKTLLKVLEENIKGFKVNYKTKAFIPNYYINASPVKFIFDGVDVDDFFVPNNGLKDEHLSYVSGILNFYLAEEIKGIELMENYSYRNNYRLQFEEWISKTVSDITYLEITTRSGSGPFLNKTPNIYRYKPQFSYGDTKVFYSPHYTSVNKDDKKPDLRSTIFWMPNLITDSDGKGNFSFFSADKKGSYTVWIEGTDLEGNFGMQTMKLEIK